MPLPAIVLFVADVERVARFYAEVGTMRELHRDADHTMLLCGGLELVIHRLRGEPASSVLPGGCVAVREDSYHKICIPVASIAAARVLASKLGGGVAPPEREWSARDFCACDGHDPEGNVIQLRQSAR